MKSQRASRLADQIQRILSRVIRLELKDPRVHLVTITDVEVSPDLSHAKVFITTLDPQAQQEEMMAGLARASGFLRSAMSRELSLRTSPQLHFVYDESVERGMQLSALIDKAVADLPPEDSAEANESEPPKS